MKSTPLSIVIPNYNGRDVLCALLASIQEQDYGAPHFEIIVIDDASTDDSVAIIKSQFPKVVVVQNDKRQGPSYAKNKGCDIATYDVVLFLDNDVELAPSCVRLLIAHMHKAGVACVQPKILFAHDREVINSAGGVANRYGYAWDRGIYEKDERQYDEKENIFFATSAAMLIRKDLLDKVGGFDADYFYLNEDYDVGFRLKMIGEKTEYVPGSVCYHHMSYTMGRDHYRVKYFIVRNRILTMIKNYELTTLVRTFYSCVCVRSRKFRSCIKEDKKNIGFSILIVMQSLLWLLFTMPRTCTKRVRYQRMRRVSDNAIFDAMGTYRDHIPKFSYV